MLFIDQRYSGEKAGDQLSTAILHLHVISETIDYVPPVGTEQDALRDDHAPCADMEVIAVHNDSEAADQPQFNDSSLEQEAIAADACRIRISSTVTFTAGAAPPSSAGTGRWKGGALVLRAGIPFEKWTKRTGIKAEQVGSMLTLAGSIGLGAAHAGGYVHRDLRLSNFVMFPEGLQLVDFDHSCRTGSEVQLTNGAIFDNRPSSMATRMAGEVVKWSQSDDLLMLFNLVLKYMRLNR